MNNTSICNSNWEMDLRNEALAFVQAKFHSKNKNVIGAAIILRLTGILFDEFSNIYQISRAKKVIEIALVAERKKAQLRRCDYNFNKHIALHQAKCMLLCRQREIQE